MALDIESIFFKRVYFANFRKVKLKEVKLHKQEVIKADHVVSFVYGKYQHKSNKELPKGESASEPVPNGDNPYAQYHKNAKYHESPANGSGSIEQLLISRNKNLLCFFGAEEKTLCFE